MPVKIAGEKKKGFPLTDQNNAAPKVTHKSDGLLPSKSHGSVTKGQAGSHGTQYKDTEVRTHGKDGTGMESGHMDEAMTGKDGPNHGKSFAGKLKLNSSVMSQALRRHQKKASPFGG